MILVSLVINCLSFFLIKLQSLLLSLLAQAFQTNGVVVGRQFETHIVASDTVCGDGSGGRAHKRIENYPPTGQPRAMHCRGSSTAIM